MKNLIFFVQIYQKFCKLSMFKHPTVQSGYSTVFGPNKTNFYVVAAGIFIKQTKTETAQC